MLASRCLYIRKCISGGLYEINRTQKNGPQGFEPKGHKGTLLLIRFFV